MYNFVELTILFSIPLRKGSSVFIESRHAHGFVVVFCKINFFHNKTVMFFLLSGVENVELCVGCGSSGLISYLNSGTSMMQLFWL